MAEDHEINQKLTTRILDKLGHAVTVVADGQEALAALRREAFDLVMMDVQMPTMDGFEAIAAIRSAEQATGRHIPSLAVTAHAMKGDRERFIRAGFDGYVSKPIQVRDLIKAIEALLSPPCATYSAEPGLDEVPDANADAVFDWAEALDTVGGDEALLREILDLFRADGPRLLGSIRAAIAGGEAPALKRAAHTLKGTASHLAAPAVFAAAHRLETMGAASDLDGADAAAGVEDVAIQALNAGAASYVPKKSLAHDLLATIDQVLAVAAVDRRRQRLLECLEGRRSRFQLSNEPELIDPLISLLQEDLDGIGFGDETTRMRVGIALQEALSNALYHGNLEVSTDLRQDDEQEYHNLATRRRGEDPYQTRRILVHAEADRDEATYVIRDEGPGFDTTILDRPIEPEDLMRVGGRGILLIRTFMDEVVFNEVGNQITLIKRRSPPARPPVEGDATGDSAL